MREIKFRAWDIDKKVMLNCWEGYGHTGQWGINNIFRDLTEDYIFEQYTGLKDKNGKEIYEGDIVKYLNQYDSYSESSGTAIIEIGDHSHLINGFTGRDIKTKYYITLMSTSELFKLEIIGNIHES